MSVLAISVYDTTLTAVEQTLRAFCDTEWPVTERHFKHDLCQSQSKLAAPRLVDDWQVVSAVRRQSQNSINVQDFF